MHWALPCPTEPFTCHPLLDFSYHQCQSFLIVICLLILMSSPTWKWQTNFQQHFRFLGIYCALWFSLWSQLFHCLSCSVSPHAFWIIFSFFLSSLSLPYPAPLAKTWTEKLLVQLCSSCPAPAGKWHMRLKHLKIHCSLLLMFSGPLTTVPVLICLETQPYIDFLLKHQRLYLLWKKAPSLQALDECLDLLVCLYFTLVLCAKCW